MGKGRVSKKVIKEQAKAIMQSNTLQEAYMKIHPESSLENANRNAYRMMKNPALLAELEKQLENVKPMEVNKTNLLRLLTMVIQSWQNGSEKTADFLRAIELLSRLVPDFSDKKQIEVYNNMDDAQLNKELGERLKKYGIGN